MAQVDEVANGIYRICTFEPEFRLNFNQFLAYPAPTTATSAPPRHHRPSDQPPANTRRVPLDG